MSEIKNSLNEKFPYQLVNTYRPKPPEFLVLHLMAMWPSPANLGSPMIQQLKSSLLTQPGPSRTLLYHCFKWPSWLVGVCAFTFVSYFDVTPWYCHWQCPPEQMTEAGEKEFSMGDNTRIGGAMKGHGRGDICSLLRLTQKVRNLGLKAAAVCWIYIVLNFLPITAKENWVSCGGRDWTRCWAS